MKNEKLKEYRLSYIDGIGDKISILIKAKSESHCLRIFRRKYGMYHIVEIVKVN